MMRVKKAMPTTDANVSSAPMLLSQKLYQPGLDYPEVLLLWVVSAVTSWLLDFNLFSQVFFGAIGLLSIVLVVQSYFKQPNIWTQLLLVVLLSICTGFFQLSIPMLCLIMVLLVRLLLIKPSYRIFCTIISIATALLSYFLTHMLLKNTPLPSLEYKILDISAMVTTIIVVFGQVYRLYSYINEEEQQLNMVKQRLITMVSVVNKLTRFIPKQVWQPIVKNNEPVAVVNRRVKLSIMFSDIAGFTELSDTLSADNLADILNTYMDRMTAIANRHGAVLDKFIGDGMVCFFGEPHSKGVREDALACVAMAIDMRREMRSLRHQWRLMGFDGLYVRIGINTGYCHVGNFGSNNRMSYTLIGKEANLASRLESVAGKSEVLISQSTYDYICHEYECQLAGSYRLKGFESPIQGYRVLDPDDNKGHVSDWVDHDLPGFNLHLNFKDIKNYDYRIIKGHLSQALERIQKEEDKIK